MEIKNLQLKDMEKYIYAIFFLTFMSSLSCHESASNTERSVTSKIQTGSFRTISSPFFLTFYYGMNKNEFNSDCENLFQKGILSRNLGEYYFEPIVNIPFKVNYNSGGPEMVDGVWTERELYQITLYCDSTSEMKWKEVFNLYLQKYGENYKVKNETSSSNFMMNTDKGILSTGSILRISYFWITNDNTRIELQRKVRTEEYEIKNLEKYRPMNGIILKHTSTVYQSSDIIKKKPEIVNTAIVIRYSAPEIVKKELDGERIERQQKLKDENEQRSRVMKNKQLI